MPDEDIRARIENVGKMHQQPKDRLWAAIFALVVLVLLVGGIVIVSSVKTKSFLNASRDFGHQRGAVECLQVVVDNDRDFGLPEYCSNPEVVVHYPPSVCHQFFPDIEACGTEWPDS